MRHTTTVTRCRFTEYIVNRRIGSEIARTLRDEARGEVDFFRPSSRTHRSVECGFIYGASVDVPASSQSRQVAHEVSRFANECE